MPNWLIGAIVSLGADSLGILIGWWMAEHSGPVVTIARPNRQAARNRGR